jgi:hypothetical protein
MVEQGIAVTLSSQELQQAALVGVMRHTESLRMGLKNLYAAAAGGAWEKNIEGACGEMAVARALDLYWGYDVNTFKAGDIGTLQVRTASRDDYGLIVRPTDRPEDLFVLVTGSNGVYVVRGWLSGRAARRDEWWRDPGGHGAAWFVPADRLHPMQTLLAEMRRQLAGA